MKTITKMELAKLMRYDANIYNEETQEESEKSLIDVNEKAQSEIIKKYGYQEQAELYKIVRWYNSHISEDLKALGWEIKGEK